DKAGLLEAATWRMFQRHDVERVRRARMQTDVRRSLADFVRENALYQYSFGTAGMALLRAATEDPDGAAVVKSVYIDSRRASIRELVERLHEAGELARLWSVEKAIDALMVLTGLPSLESLTIHSRLKIDEAAGVLVQLAKGLLRPTER